jgi:hypothetical protein
MDIDKSKNNEIIDVEVKPLVNSLNCDIHVLDQPSLLKIFDEDIPADNKIRFGSEFKGPFELNWNSIHQILKSEKSKAGIVEEVSITLHSSKNSFSNKFGLKSNRFSIQTDFGYSLLKMNFAGNNLNSWINPYSIIDINRSTGQVCLSLGALSFTKNWGSKNTLFTFYKEYDCISCDMISNSSFKYKNFFFSAFITNSLCTPWISNERSLLFGVKYKNFVSALKIDKNTPGDYLDWKFNNFRLLTAHEFNIGHRVGLEIFKNLFLSSNLKCSFVHHYIYNSFITLKSKIDNDFNSSMFVEYRFAKYLRIQFFTKANLLTFRNSNGFLKSPFSLGFKLCHNN